MAHNPKSTVPTDEHILDVTADPDTQVDDLKRLAELAKNASPEARARLENTIALVAQSRQIRSMTTKTVQSMTTKTVQTELHSMDEETRSLAELLILKDLGGK